MGEFRVKTSPKYDFLTAPSDVLWRGWATVKVDASFCLVCEFGFNL